MDNIVNKPVVLKKLMAEMDRVFVKYDIPWNYRLNVGEDLSLTEEFPKDSEYYFAQRLSSGTIGGKCKRKIFFAYHQVAKCSFAGRLHRLFNFGHMIEKMTLGNLHVCGYDPIEFDPEVLKATGNYKQFSYTTMNNRVVAKPDGKLPNGVIGHEKLSLLEIKSAKLSEYMKYKNQGVRKTNPKYWDQVQLAMALGKIPYCVFIVTCKDDSNVYAELIHYDKHDVKRISDLCKKILNNPQLLPPKSDEYCYNCDYRHVCAGGEVLKRCRTCSNYGWKNNLCGLDGHDCGYCEPCINWNEIKMIGKW